MNDLYVIPHFENIEESLKIAEKYGANFEYNDFFIPSVLDDKEECQKRIDFYKSLDRDRSRDTSHGVFLDITVHSDDRLVREVSDYRIRQSMDIAKQLGIRGVIFHTNMISNYKDPVYMDNWVKRNDAYWRKITAEYPSLTVFMENMFDDEPEMLKRLAESMSDVKNFSICFDYAHARVFGDGSIKWSECLLPYAGHMHINDNDGNVDSHLAVGDGTTDWNEYDMIMRKKGCSATVLIETTPIERQQKSLEYMSEHHIFPFD